ncbi:patatin-like phospholipase family protein [Pelomonas sp. KK5]|uniref:patatin-like phospholipase family protein n=1 Tax=Pelomonas sp. KK5 TaxID=1855730 RepID=UPI00097CA02A|nr:patatin-like phospholipase family protein [Pelomonas sp. KK5]
MDDDDALRKTRDAWLSRVLGVSVLPAAGAAKPPVPPPLPPRKPVRVTAVRTKLPHPGATPHPPRARSGAVIAAPDKPQVYTSPTGKTIKLAHLPGGGISYTAPPPPVTEITFSGGGGKGVALPGAVKALQDSGVLKDARRVAGASVGSMTAALVAAGITSDEFTNVANDDETTARIVEGTGGTKLGLIARAMKNIGSPLTGEGLETLVREVLDETLRKRIVEYMEACGKSGIAPDPTVVEIVKRLSSNKTGPTFLDMRKLSVVIPAVKEVVITGTYLKQVDAEAGKDASHGQLYVFDADSEPSLEVAVAVHASASFPKAFKPVDIKLSSGIVARFIDGGVMNNTPTTSTLGRDRELDPVPPGRGVTFVFEDKDGVAKDMLAGKVKPETGRLARLIDWAIDSNTHGAEYGKNRELADKPQELVMVPLKLTLPPKKPGDKGHEIDMRDGTLDFNVPMADKLALQSATEQATLDQVNREKQDRSRSFATESQMFCCIPMDELKTLQAQHYKGAAAAVHFREQVATQVDLLLTLVAMGTTSGVDPAVVPALAALDKAAGADLDFQALVARELNKRPQLDNLMASVRGSGRTSPALEASYAVADMVKAQAHADEILKQLVYPAMTKQSEGGTGLATLLDMETRLRKVRSAKDVNTALDIGIKHFASKSDINIPKRGHKALAAALATRKM